MVGSSSAFRFVMLSGFSFSTNLGLTVGLHELFGVPAEVAVAIALAVVFVCNFVGMRYLVYDARHVPIAKQFVAFCVASVLFRMAEYGAFLITHTWFQFNYIVAWSVILFASFVAKYCFYGRAVFGTRSEGTALERSPGNSDSSSVS